MDKIQSYNKPIIPNPQMTDEETVTIPRSLLKQARKIVATSVSRLMAGHVACQDLTKDAVHFLNQISAFEDKRDFEGCGAADMSDEDIKRSLSSLRDL